jgi:hypothetical protein
MVLVTLVQTLGEIAGTLQSFLAQFPHTKNNTPEITRTSGAFAFILKSIAGLPQLSDLNFGSRCTIL